MSPAEIKQYPELAKAAMLEELRTWGERFMVMKIADYYPNLNVMTSRYVITWREVDGRTVMRYRLTLRGFQDWYKDDYETYAGTAARMSQRWVSSECAAHQLEPEPWIIAIIDIEKAFLQGLSYEEIHARTKEPLREVYFYFATGICRHASEGKRL